jgi:hypothetical protein
LLEAVGGAAGVRARPDYARGVIGLNSGFGVFDGEDTGKCVVLNLDAMNGGNERGFVWMCEARTMANCDQSMTGSKVMLRMVPRAMLERTVAPCHMPGSTMSSM